MGAIRPVGVVGGKRKVPNWGDGSAANTEQKLNNNELLGVSLCLHLSKLLPGGL